MAQFSGCEWFDALSDDTTWPREPLQPDVGIADRVRWETEDAPCTGGGAALDGVPTDEDDTSAAGPTHVLVLCDGKTCAEGYRSFEPGGAFLGAYCVSIDEFESWRASSCPDCTLDCGGGDDMLAWEPHDTLLHLAPCRIRLPGDDP